MREHNWQVDRLAAKHPEWTQDQLFEAARAITEAEWQHVVYDEYLPKLVGENAIKDYKGYKSSVNPAVINEWTTVAFRFGHDQSSNVFRTLAENGGSTGSFTLGQSFALANTAQAIRTSGSMDEWVRGQLAHHTQEIDGKIVEGNRNALFGIPGATVDLNVFDIARARDHGVGNYNALREGLKLKTYATFEAFAKDNKLDAATLAALKDVYGNDITKMDSLVGGLLEKNHKDSQLGETFTRLTVMQFENLRDGDRLYYENRLKGNADLLREVDSTSMADIIARTSGIKYVYHDAFAAHERIGGTSGGETLAGTSKHDLIIGFDGNDIAKGGKGNDDIYGGKDKDDLSGEDGNDQVFGEEGDDHLSGGKGNDTLCGGAGKDSLDGGTGLDRDVFVFDAALGAGNVDTIKNYGALDKIQLDNEVFIALKEGQLAASAFRLALLGGGAQDADDRIIYQVTTGKLLYDPDGKGGADAIQFAQLDPKVALLSHQDFTII
jgi:peroxidase